MKVDVAIVSAIPEELEFIKTTWSNNIHEWVTIDEFEFPVYIYKNKKIVVTPIGVGTTFAASVTALIDSYFNPDYFFLSGTAGAIKPGLKIGDVIIVAQAFEAEIQGIFTILKNTPFESCLQHPLNKQHFPNVFAADTELLAMASAVSLPNITIHQGTVVSSNTFPAPQELFAKLKSQNPYSIDMETSALYQYCWLRQKKALAFRGISNILNHDGTDDQVHLSDVPGSAQAASMVLLKTLDNLLAKLNTGSSVNLPAATNATTQLIKLLELQPHPEGGHLRRYFQADALVHSDDSQRYNGEARLAGTASYYLLTEHDFSAWHQLKSDEIWHYHKGSAIKIYIIDSNGDLHTFLLGDKLLASDANFSIAIKSGNWFAAELLDNTPSSFGLISCSVMPGFDYKDFVLADCETLSKQFPQHKDLIAKFSR